VAELSGDDYFGPRTVAEFEASLYRVMDELIALDHERDELARQLAAAAEQLVDIRKQLAKAVKPQPTAGQDAIVRSA
jgi:predicted  nucleic acid-binding Zn-ribbon protein